MTNVLMQVLSAGFGSFGVESTVCHGPSYFSSSHRPTNLLRSGIPGHADQPHVSALSLRGEVVLCLVLLLTEVL